MNRASMWKFKEIKPEFDNLMFQFGTSSWGGILINNNHSHVTGKPAYAGFFMPKPAGYLHLHKKSELFVNKRITKHWEFKDNLLHFLTDKDPVFIL